MYRRRIATDPTETLQVGIAGERSVGLYSYEDGLSGPPPQTVNTSPGQRQIQLLAADEDGLWNDVGASIILTTPPKFYQTRWFYTLCGLLVLLALWQL
jgi:hypothetical protein